MSEKRPDDDAVDFLVGLLCSVGVVIAIGCMLYLFVTAP